MDTKKLLQKFEHTWASASTSRNMVVLMLDYIEMLSAELEETAPLAAMRGWKSSRVEEGRRLRAELGVEEGKEKP